MIVICTGCQARFRVADEKVGPRGARVRCTKCQNVFLVTREAAPRAPAIELDLTPGLARPTPARDPFAPAPGSGAVIPFPMASHAGAPAPDPFVAAGIVGFDGPAAAADDPFLPGRPDQRSVKFPPTELGRSGPLAQAAGPAEDPFAAPDPFAAATSLTNSSLPVTDLAQLLGGAGARAAISAPPQFELPPPEPALTPAAATPAPFAALAGDLTPAAATPAPFVPFAGDLTLEERKDAEPAPPAFADPADVFAAEAAPTSFAAAFPQGVWDDGPLGPPVPGDESLALATDKTPGPPTLERPAPALAEEPLRPSSRQPPEMAEPDEAAAAAHPGLAPRGELRSAAVNALALVALVAVALGMRAVLRGDEPLGPGALRPARLLQAFGGARAPAAPFEVAEVRTGVYPQASGGTVLFVRGVVICRDAAPTGGVKVAAELVREGRVLARGEVLAGAEPTPEDVWKAADRAGLEALAHDLGSRAPKKVAAGQRLAFLITVADAPAELSGASVRLQAGAPSP